MTFIMFAKLVMMIYNDFLQASMSSFGFNNVLCGQITADPNVDKCDRKLRFYHAPIDACNRFEIQYFRKYDFFIFQ